MNFNKGKFTYIDRTLWVYFTLSLGTILLSKLEILKIFGSNFDEKLSIFPIGSFMLGKGIFDDFYNSVGLAFSLPDPSSAYLLTPLMILISRWASIAPLYAHLLFLALSLGLWAYAFTNMDMPPRTFLPLLLSFPILFAVSRSNPILLGAGLIFLAYSLSYGVKVKSSISALCAALSISIHPGCLLLLLGLPVIKMLKKWYLFLLVFSINILAIYKISNGEFINFYTSYASALNLYSQSYIIGSGGSLFNNSFYGALKEILIFFNASLEEYKDALIKLNYIYSNLSNILIISIALYSLLSKNVLKKIILLCLITVFLPKISADYKLLFVIIAISFLINFANRSKFDLPINIKMIFILLLVIILPKHYIFFRVFSDYGELFTIQTIINPILELLAIILTILISKSIANSSALGVAQKSDLTDTANHCNLSRTS